MNNESDDEVMSNKRGFEWIDITHQAVRRDVLMAVMKSPLPATLVKQSKDALEGREVSVKDIAEQIVFLVDATVERFNQETK